MKDYRLDIEGYRELCKEIEVLRKYGHDYRMDKGKWAQYVNRLHPQRLKLRVSERIQETASTTTLRLVPVEGYLPPFQAGQYINLFVEIGGVRTSRPYSISSSPTQIAYYDITVRRIQNGFVSDYLLDKIAVGDILESGSPTGNFHYNPLYHGNELVFIAGGSGITPFMSMIREAIDRGLQRKIHLLYGSQTLEEAIFHHELTEKAEHHPSFKYHLILSQPPAGYAGLSGLIDEQMISRLVGDSQDKTFYLCGPPAMYEFCLPALQSLGVPRKRIRRELYGAVSDIHKAPGWPKEVSTQNQVTVDIKGGRAVPQKLKAQTGEPLVVALERNGIQVPTSCRSGECSLCRIKLLSGKVFEFPGEHVRKSDRDHGYVHACESYPLTDLEILL